MSVWVKGNSVFASKAKDYYPFINRRESLSSINSVVESEKSAASAESHAFRLTDAAVFQASFQLLMNRSVCFGSLSFEQRVFTSGLSSVIARMISDEIYSTQHDFVVELCYRC